MLLGHLFSDFGPHFAGSFNRGYSSQGLGLYLSTMAFYIATNCVIVASIFFPLLSCAPLTSQEAQEDPDLYRTAVR